jgi:hypothetical protein
MNKVQEFRRRAIECQDLAARASNNDLRGHYEGLARVWSKLAEERLAFFVEDPEKKKRAAG